MDYDDMRDMQRREEQGDDYISPTRAYTANEWIEGCEDYGEDVMLEVMERDMARYDSELKAQQSRRIAYLQSLLDEAGIDYDE